MGKFDGVLLLSDFDNTLVYTEDALLSGGRLPPLNSANREAIHYFMAEGGIFSVATGRALPSFAPIAPTLPMNGRPSFSMEPPFMTLPGRSIWKQRSCRRI